MRKLGFIAIFAIVLLCIPTVAQANSAGQCSGPSGKPVFSTSAFHKNLQTERVVPQAAKVFKSAGYSQRDGSVQTWLNNDTTILRLAAPVTIKNFGCRDGKLFEAGNKTLRRNAQVLVSLPKRYGKGDFSPRKTKKFPKKLVVEAEFVGQITCTNPGEGDVRVIIWVPKKPKKAPKKPAPKPTPQPAPVPPTTPQPAPTPPTTPPAPEQPRPVNQIPACEKVKAPEHIYPGKSFELKFRCTDPEGASLTIFAEPMWGQLTFVKQEGNVYTYRYSAINPDGTPLEPGQESITVMAMDPLKATNAPLYINFPIPVDER